MAVSLDYVAKETARNLWRNRMMALAAILTVAVSLSLVGSALLLRQAMARQIAEFGNNLSMQIFMNPTAPQQQITGVRNQIQQTPQIESFKFLDHAQSYAQAKKVLANDPVAVQAMGPSGTPTVFDLKMKHPNSEAAVAAVFKGSPGVLDVSYPAASLRILQQLTNVLQTIAIVIAIVLLISSLVLILNAIRMAIFARRREVGVMKLVGATNWFIRIPFMLEGLVQGLLGAAIAVGVVLLANLGVGYLIHHYHVNVLGSTVLPAEDLLWTELVVVFVGIVIGVAGSSVAIRRFLDV